MSVNSSRPFCDAAAESTGAVKVKYWIAGALFDVVAAEIQERVTAASTATAVCRDPEIDNVPGGDVAPT